MDFGSPDRLTAVHECRCSEDDQAIGPIDDEECFSMRQSLIFLVPAQVNLADGRMYVVLGIPYGLLLAWRVTDTHLGKHSFGDDTVRKQSFGVSFDGAITILWLVAFGEYDDINIRL